MDAHDREMLAARLVELGAYRHDAGEGFLLASGRRSPHYVDCRGPLCVASFRAMVGQLVALGVNRAGLYPDSVGGLETGAIPLACAVSAHLGARMFWVRKAEKGHGVAGSVVGAHRDRDAVVVVDDVLTSGESVIRACSAVGARDAWVLVDRGEGGAERCASRGITVRGLVSLGDLLGVSA